VRVELGLSDEEVELARRALGLDDLLLLARLVEGLALGLLLRVALALLRALGRADDLRASDERREKRRTSRRTRLAFCCVSLESLVLLGGLRASRATTVE